MTPPGVDPSLIASDNADQLRLHQRLDHVFRVRHGTPPSPDLPAPPRSWVEDYAALIASLRCAARTLDTAYPLVRGLYLAALTERTDP